MGVGLFRCFYFIFSWSRVSFSGVISMFMLLPPATSGALACLCTLGTVRFFAIQGECPYPECLSPPVLRSSRLRLVFPLARLRLLLFVVVAVVVAVVVVLLAVLR
jgi:hypothetical protein